MLQPTMRPALEPGPPQSDDARALLLERGGAEFLRARRYGRDFGIVAVHLTEMSGPVALDVIEAVIRTGPDEAVRLAPDRFVALLPETPLSGAIHLAARVQLGLSRCRLPSRVGFAAMDHEDERFVDMLTRACKMADKA